MLPVSDSFCGPGGGDEGKVTPLPGDPNAPATAAGDVGTELLPHAATAAVVAATTSTANDQARLRSPRNILVTAPIDRYDSE